MQRSSWQMLCRIAIAAIGGGALGAGTLRAYELHSCADSLRRHDRACSKPAAAVEKPYRSLENEVRARLERMQSEGKLARASVYFQRLNDGVGFGIDEDAKFTPASLMKVPVAFAMFLLNTEQPGSLSKELTYATDSVKHFAVPTQVELEESGLELGKDYSIETLLRAVVMVSDNLAYYIVLEYMNGDPARTALLWRTFRELGIQDPRNVEDEAASVREYAGVFRQLYNTSYLDAASSEKLLTWLRDSKYDKGIARGAPTGSAVANKFGERVLADGTCELHDCGIVYGANEPYLLCIMTKGREFPALQAVIAEISETVYAAAATSSH